MLWHEILKEKLVACEEFISLSPNAAGRAVISRLCGTLLYLLRASGPCAPTAYSPLMWERASCHLQGSSIPKRKGYMNIIWLKRPPSEMRHFYLPSIGWSNDYIWVQDRPKKAVWPCAHDEGLEEKFLLES